MASAVSKLIFTDRNMLYAVCVVLLCTVYCGLTSWTLAFDIVWHAINHETGEIIAYVFGAREPEVLQKLLALLSGLNVEITSVFSDDTFVYYDAVPQNILQTGKGNTQRIERKHLTFRTRFKRLARKTICYSKSLEMHTTLFGLLINTLEFNRELF
jgi:insertion element IS1 protein InsB